MSKTRLKGSLKRDLEDIVQTCGDIENRKFNPFLLDISEALRLLRHHSERLGSLEDHLLDMRALTSIAKVVGLQSAHLRFQSSSLFVDPEVAKRRVQELSRQQLAELFLLAWHPVVELEQITSASMKEALDYWRQLLSFFERRRRWDLGPLSTAGEASVSELTEAGLLQDRVFTSRLDEVWEELKQRAVPDGKVEYWTFVRVDSFSETVTRAQLVSFLVSYGYASMEKDGERISLIPREKPELSLRGSPLSLPIAITRGGS